jgi:hypothetical protein
MSLKPGLLGVDVLSARAARWWPTDAGSTSASAASATARRFR